MALTVTLTEPTAKSMGTVTIKDGKARRFDLDLTKSGDIYLRDHEGVRTMIAGSEPATRIAKALLAVARA